MSCITDLSPELVESLNKREVDIVYERLDPAVWVLVDRLLGYVGQEDNLLRQTHLNLSTPHLAVQAIKTNIGGQLPTFELERKMYGWYKETGKTRIIEPDDEFVILGGPLANGPHRGFTSVLHRASTIDQVDSSTRTRLVCNDFADIPMLG